VTRRAAAVAALLAAAACSRTKEVRPGEEKNAGQAPSDHAAGVPSRPGHPPVPAAPQGLVEKDAVVHAQRALSERGLLREHQEGELDAPTSAAIRKLQEQQGLAATGFPDHETLRRLGVDPEHAYIHEGEGKGPQGQQQGAREQR
jgi:peptidoglycan hydrolase-like protein with peptidoglycan-binding domain